MPNSGGKWVTASTGWTRSRSGWRACPAPSAASIPSAPGRYCWRRRACWRSGSSRRRCAGAAPCSRCSRSSGRRARRCRIFWLPADGRTFAVRGADGRLAFHHAGGDAFAIHEWLAADADGRDAPRSRAWETASACDPSGCIGKLADGRLIAYALAPDAFEEDCRRATVIVATRDAPPDCAATVIGRSLWRDARSAGAAPRRRGLCRSIWRGRRISTGRGPMPTLLPTAASRTRKRAQDATPRPGRSRARIRVSIAGSNGRPKRPAR